MNEENLPICLGGKAKDLRQVIEHYINYFSLENGSNTPDFILADYLMGCLETFDKTMKRREEWFGRPIEGKPVDGPPPITPEP